MGDTLSIAFPDPVLISLKEVYKKSSKAVFKGPIREKKSVVVNSIDLLENVPPRTENEVRLQGVPHNSGRARPLCCYYELQAWKPALSWDIFLSVTCSISNVVGFLCLTSMNTEAGMSERSAPLQTSNSLSRGLNIILMDPLQSCGHCKSPGGSSLASSSQLALPSCLLVCHISCLRGRGGLFTKGSLYHLELMLRQAELPMPSDVISFQAVS